MELSIEDIRAIRSADYACVFYRPDKGEGPVWGIRVGKRTDDPVWGTSETRRLIPANPEHCTLTNYAPGQGIDHIREAVAVQHFYRPFDLTASTPFDALKVGDEIGVHFVGNNSSENTRKVDYVRDECYLRAVRKGKIVAEYLVDVYVGPDNSARIVHS